MQIEDKLELHDDQFHTLFNNSFIRLLLLHCSNGLVDKGGEFILQEIEQSRKVLLSYLSQLSQDEFHLRGACRWDGSIDVGDQGPAED